MEMFHFLSKYRIYLRLETWVNLMKMEIIKGQYNINLTQISRKWGIVPLTSLMKWINRKRVIINNWIQLPWITNLKNTNRMKIWIKSSTTKINYEFHQNRFQQRANKKCKQLKTQAKSNSICKTLSKQR